VCNHPNTAQQRLKSESNYLHTEEAGKQTTYVFLTLCMSPSPQLINLCTVPGSSLSSC
jgi:hypothetical protein